MPRRPKRKSTPDLSPTDIALAILADPDGDEPHALLGDVVKSLPSHRRAAFVNDCKRILELARDLLEPLRATTDGCSRILNIFERVFVNIQPVLAAHQRLKTAKPKSEKAWADEALMRDGLTLEQVAVRNREPFYRVKKRRERLLKARRQGRA